ncbi:MAG: ABC transporter ATP-binding protein [Variibacter sp.]|nr:ABC transporter ATP-binding protein [Variibacter sp.]
MLSITDLTASYRPGAQVLHGVSVDLAPRSIAAVIGANGAGKTTLLRAILAQVPHRSGSIMLNGEPLAGLKTHEIVHRGLRVVPEGRGTFRSMSVEENLDMGGYGLAAGELARRKEREFARFPVLGERARQRAGMLSGGEQQMLAIARAMMGNPKALLLDEPSQGLAPIVVDQIFALFDTLRAEGIGILLVEQDVGRALEVADHAFVLEKGKITRSDRAQALLVDPSVREAFLGIA